MFGVARDRHPAGLRQAMLAVDESSTRAYVVGPTLRVPLSGPLALEPQGEADGRSADPSLDRSRRARVSLEPLFN